MAKTALRTPTITYLAGVSGSGKSTIAKELSNRVYDICHIDKDTINDSFLLTVDNSKRGTIGPYRLSGPKYPRNSEYFHRNVKYQTYRCMLELAKNALRFGQHPVVEGNYVKEIGMNYFDEIVPGVMVGLNLQHKSKLILCYADEETIRQRVLNRNSDRDENKKISSAWNKQLAQHPIIPPKIEEHNHIRIDTAHPLEEIIEDIIDYLKN